LPFSEQNYTEIRNKLVKYNLKQKKKEKKVKLSEHELIDKYTHNLLEKSQTIGVYLLKEWIMEMRDIQFHKWKHEFDIMLANAFYDYPNLTDELQSFIQEHNCFRKTKLTILHFFDKITITPFMINIVISSLAWTNSNVTQAYPEFT